MSAKAIKLDENGDLDLSRRNTLRLTETNVEYVSQRVTQRLKFSLGEWFLDQRKGVPYFKHIFIKRPDISLAKAVFARTILGTSGILALTDIVTKFDPRERTLDVTWSAKLTSGEILANQSVEILD